MSEFFIFELKLNFILFLFFLFSSKVFAEELPGTVHIINSLAPDSNGFCKTDLIVNSNAKKGNEKEHLCLAISDEK